MLTLGDPPFYGVEPGHQTLPPSPLRYTTPLSDKKPSRHSACISQLSTQTGEGIQGRPGNKANKTRMGKEHCKML